MKVRAHQSILAGSALALLVLPVFAYSPDNTVKPITVETAIERLSKFGAYRRELTASPRQIELGRRLFSDPRLSSHGKMSCSTCHMPSRHFADGLPRAIGRNGKPVARKTPSLLTAAFQSELFWDGRAATVEEAALIAVQNPEEMAQPLPALAAKVAALPGYAAAFAAAYPGAAVSSTTIGQALGAYVRSLAAAEDSPFDHFLADGTGLSSGATRGFLIFTQGAGCVNCHGSRNFNYIGRYRNIGLAPGRKDDPGRYLVNPRPAMWGAFRIPTLRNVALTAPYMHDGRFATLREVIDYHDRGGDKTRYQDGEITALHLGDGEKEDLLAFLQALTSSRHPEEDRKDP